MKTIITAIAAISMVAATSAAAYEHTPQSIEEMIAETARMMCGAQLDKIIPAYNSSGRATCRQVALHESMLNRHRVTSVNVV